MLSVRVPLLVVVVVRPDGIAASSSLKNTRQLPAGDDY